MLKFRTSATVLSTESQSSKDKGQLLIVDDEKDLLTTLKMLFSPFYSVEIAESGEKALEIIKNGFIPHVIISDQRMPGMSGTEFLASSMKLVPHTVRVVLTGYSDVRDITDSINLGSVYRFITKPWRNEDLIDVVRTCFEHFFLSEEKVALQAALEQVETVSREKSDILEIVIHDLKNPLNAIIGIGDLISNGKELGFQQEDYQKFGKELLHASSRMMTLIKNLLNMHALESGNLEVKFIPLNISSLANLLAEDMQPRATAKEITLHVSPEIQEYIFADEVFCHQIIENLLSNAIKYSPSGKKIWLQTEYKNETVRLSVKDEGPGISDQDQAKMFTKFTRLSAIPTAGEDSTGLGLSIVKRFAEKMNARVFCESELGKGSTFIVEFPVYRE